MLCELCLTCKTYFYVLPQEQVARHVARRFASRRRHDEVLGYVWMGLTFCVKILPVARMVR